MQDAPTRRPRSRIARWLIPALAGLVVVALAGAALTIFAWTIDETRFDRPNEAFDRLIDEVGELSQVSVEGSERWVEAPTFADPTSWIDVTVDEKGFTDLIDLACSTGYPDSVTWSIGVQIDNGALASLHGTSAAADSAGRADRCPDFGFDAVGLVGAMNELPTVAVQPSIGEDGTFALVSLDDDGNLSELLPLVQNAEGLRAAAGLGSDRLIEINSPALIVVIEPDEHAPYSALLATLVREHGVTSIWADGSGTPIDGIETVQVVAPEGDHAGVAEIIRTSGLHIAEFPVRFLPR